MFFKCTIFLNIFKITYLLTVSIYPSNKSCSVYGRIPFCLFIFKICHKLCQHYLLPTYGPVETTVNSTDPQLTTERRTRLYPVHITTNMSQLSQQSLSHILFLQRESSSKNQLGIHKGVNEVSATTESFVCVCFLMVFGNYFS